MSSEQRDCETSLTSSVVETEGVHGHLAETKPNEISEERRDKEAGNRNSQCCAEIKECGQVARESHLSEVFCEAEGSKIVKNLVSENCVESVESMKDNVNVNDNSVERVNRKNTSLENVPSVHCKSAIELLKVKTVFRTPESYVKSSEDKMIEPHESHILSNTVESCQLRFEDCRKNMSKDGYESDDSISSRITVVLQNDCNQNRKEVSYNKSKPSNVEMDYIPTNDTFSGNGLSYSVGDESHEIGRKELMVRNNDNEDISEAESNPNNDKTIKSHIQVAVKELQNEQNNNYPNQQCEMEDEKDIGCDSSSDFIVNQSHNQINSELDRVKTTTNLGEREKTNKEREIIECISTCASLDITRNKCNQSKGDEPQDIDNSDLEKEVVETKSISERNTLEKVMLELLSESGSKSTLESQDSANHSESPQISVQTVLDDLQQKQITTPVKEHNTCPSSENLTVKKSPLFQRGLFPRIALKDSGVRSIKRLEKQLFKEREKREKRERKLEDIRTHPSHSFKIKSIFMKKRTRKNDLSTLEKKMCDNTETPYSTNDIELKCLRVCLVKIDEQMLSKYNVHLPNLHSRSVINKEPKDPIPVYDELSFVSKNGTDQISDLNTKVVPCVFNSRFGDVQIQDKQLVHSMQDPGNHNEAKSKSLYTTQAVTNVSYSRRNRKISVLENTADCSRENGSSLLESLVSIKGSKRRTDSEEPKSSAIKMPKLSTYKPKLKIARIHILKIDSSVLSKYGYDTQDIKSANTTVVAYPTTADSSVITPVKNDINALKTGTNQRMNTRCLSNQPVCDPSKIVCPTLSKSPLKIDEYSSPKTNSGNKFVNMNSTYTKRGTMNKSFDSINLKAAQVVLTNIDDVSLYKSISLKKWPTRNVKQLMSRPKGSVKNSIDNLKTDKVNVSKIDDLRLSSRVNSKKSPTLGPAKSSTRTKRIIKSDCINLKTTEVILKNVEGKPNSSPVVSTKVHTENTLEPMSKREKTERMVKKGSNTSSTGIVYSKKQIVPDQTKYSKEDRSAKEVVKRREKRLCKNKMIMNDYLKENKCLNGEPVHLKFARVDLLKLDSVSLPKFLSSHSLVFGS